MSFFDFKNVSKHKAGFFIWVFFALFFWQTNSDAASAYCKYRFDLSALSSDTASLPLHSFIGVALNDGNLESEAAVQTAEMRVKMCLQEGQCGKELLHLGSRNESSHVRSRLEQACNDFAQKHTVTRPFTLRSAAKITLLSSRYQNSSGKWQKSLDHCENGTTFLAEQIEHTCQVSGSVEPESDCETQFKRFQQDSSHWQAPICRLIEQNSSCYRSYIIPELGGESAFRRACLNPFALCQKAYKKQYNENVCALVKAQSRCETNFVYATKENGLRDTDLINQYETQCSLSNFGTISGVITGDKIKDVRIKLRGNTQQTAVTDTEGRFIFRELDAGTYTLSANANGYDFGKVPASLTLDTGQTVDLVLRSSVVTPDLKESLFYEAEDMTNSDRVNVNSEAAWASGAAYISFARETHPRDDAWVEWCEVKAPETGIYQLNFHYAYRSGFVPKHKIMVNSQHITSEPFSSTGSWQQTGTLSFSSRLEKGKNCVKLSLGTHTSSPRIDRLEISSVRQEKNNFATALDRALSHMRGDALLTAPEFATIKTAIDDGLKVLPEGDSAIIAKAFEFVETYEEVYGPLFLNTATRIGGRGWERGLFEPNIDTVALSLMQGIVDFVYTSPFIIDNQRALLEGFWFKTSEHFPGKVTGTPEHITTQVKCDFPDVYGRKIAFDDVPARKPTGAYLAPGSIATVSVPENLVGKGFQVRVGAHARDHRTRPFVRRLDRPSIAYPITRSEIEIASPLGGGVYIEVPPGAAEGIQEIAISNAIRAPYFSLQAHHQTSLDEWRNNLRNSGAPWADFKTDKFMLQIPTSYISRVNDPKSVLEEWDQAIDVVSDLMGFPRIRGNELLYIQFDVMIKGPAYSIGYPQINHTYSAYRNGNGAQAQFTQGPRFGFNHIEFHELGHALGMQKFPGENESVVNLPYVAVMNQLYGDDLNVAFRKSRDIRNSYMNLDTTAITWMTSKHFLEQKSMTKLDMQYQLKGHARYVEIARLFGWEVIGKYWRSILEDEENGLSIDRSVDGLILRLSKAAGVDLTPLIQFWGVQPQNATRLKERIAAAELEPSAKVYDMLMHYAALIPDDNLAFRQHALQWWGKEPRTEAMEGTQSDHDTYFETYDRDHAEALRDIMQSNLDSYFPDGRPNHPQAKVKVFILSGQSNMHGHGEIGQLHNPNVQQTFGTLQHAVSDDPDSDFYQFLVDHSDDFRVRDDVFIRTHDRGGRVQAGQLTIGYGTDQGKSIGPELGFGHVIGDEFDEPVLLIKAAWGGKSLFSDFRPPSRSGETGAFYNELLSIVEQVTSDIGLYVPSYSNQGFELAGFVWHQGWNDRVNREASQEYEQNMAAFIRDIRLDLEAPDLPFVIATTGMAPTANYTEIELAQLAMGNGTRYPEFADNVRVVDTRGDYLGRPFWFPGTQSPHIQGQEFHWNRNGKTHVHIGMSMADAMIELLR